MRTRIAAVGIVLALVISGCGSTKETTTSKAVKGGVFREGLVQLGSEDPAKAQTVSERQMADQLYDGLTTWSPNDLVAAPALASKWETTQDQQHWTFHLREDAKASNGEAVTASDVKKSLEHVARKSSGSFATDLLSMITGFANFSTNDQVPSLDGITVVDPTTVKIDLDAPYGDLALLLGNPSFGIVHYGSTPATTGPFMIKERRDATHVVLVKSPSSAANLDQIEVTFFPDVGASYAAFENKSVDWTPVPSEQAADAGNKYGKQLFVTSLRTLYLTFNLANPKFANPDFRSAIIQSINRSRVVKQMGGVATDLDGIVPTGIPGGSQSGCGAPCAYNVDRAKQSVAKAFPNGEVPPISIDISSGPPFNELSLQSIVDDLGGIGVVATVKTTPADKYSAVTVDPNRELFQTSWSAAYPSSGAFIQPLFQHGSPSNVSRLNDAKVNDGIAGAEKIGDPSARLSAFAGVELSVLQQMPVVPLATFPVDSVEQPRVRGIVILPTGNFDAALAWVTTPQP